MALNGKFNPAGFVEFDDDGDGYLPLDVMLKWFYSEHPGWRFTMEDGYEAFSFRKDMRIAEEDDQEADPIYVDGYNMGFDDATAGAESTFKEDSADFDENSPSNMEKKGYMDGYSDASENRTNKFKPVNRRVNRNLVIFSVSLIDEKGTRCTSVHIDVDADKDGFAQLAYQKGIETILNTIGFGASNITDEMRDENENKNVAISRKFNYSQPEVQPQQVYAPQPQYQQPVQQYTQQPVYNNQYQQPVQQQYQPPAPAPVVEEKSPVTTPANASNETAELNSIMDKYWHMLSPAERSELSNSPDKLREKFEKFCLSLVGSSWKKIKNDGGAKQRIIARIEERSRH